MSGELSLTANPEKYSIHFKLFKWYSNESGNWLNALLKWMILAIEEQKCDPEQQYIDICKGEIAGEYYEIITYTFNEHVAKVRMLYKKFQGIKEDETLRTQLLDEIYEMLGPNEESNFCRENIGKLSTEQRSVLRIMMHQSIQAHVAFIRTTIGMSVLNAKACHCITNTYFMELNDKWHNALKEISGLKAENISVLKTLKNNADNLNYLINQKSTEIESLEQKNKQLTEKIDELKNKLIESDNKASHLQAALGDATNVRWGDDTQYNFEQIRRNIINLQNEVQGFTDVDDTDQIEYGAERLFKRYKNDNPNDKEKKSLLSTILQRFVLENIFDEAKNFSQYSQYHESKIVSSTDELIRHMTELPTNSDKDRISNVAPIKVRQQSYAVLASQGFAKPNHPYIEVLTKWLIDEMNKYRRVSDKTREEDLRLNAADLIRSIFKLWFCLMAQESMPEIKWFEFGDHINSDMISGC
ncbi:3027_t:CDS:2 [Racocetra persica]|uniref:3027_t:CDS:1 n=1 Tax=Racocetra persica TaxID=160502 RepID=A0ACA9LLM0_9GLOM|nr:3027_t:CDS:2 [Racocetra persica]